MKTKERRDDLIDLGCGTQIADDAIANGYTPERIRDNGEDGDQRLTLWECNGVRVIDTNGDAVWEESDPDGFADLLSRVQDDS